MDSTRQKKVARLLQKELGEIFQREGRNYFGPVMITVTGVRISPDMAMAKVYISLFGINDKAAMLKQIRQHKSDIRRALGSRVKNQLRVTPDLEFFIDDSLDYAENIDRLLKGDE